MIRNLKTLGLALIAVFAMSAVVASASQAEEFTAESYPVTISGEQATGEEKHVFTVEGGRKVECEKATFMSHTTLGAASPELTIDPTYANCHANILGAVTDATVTFSPCDFLFTTATKTPGGSYIAHLVCPTGSDVTIHVYTENNGVHDTAHELCAYTIQPQTIENGIEYINMAASGSTKEDLTVKANSTGIAVKRTVGTKTKCGEENQSASYKGNTTVQGENPTTHASVGIMVG